MIKAKIIADSLSPEKIRITTFSLTYPRFIHSEFMTHRLFSRNASSSRAIPVEKEMEKIRTEMAMPLKWGLNQKGMQATKYVTDPEEKTGLSTVWAAAAEDAMKWAQILHDRGIHKQHVNRLLEPFQHIDVIMTTTQINNFLALRHHHMAQPEIEELAKRMYQALKESTPINKNYGEWHLPFVTEEHDKLSLEEKIKTSVACCARVSYRNHDGTTPTLEQNMQLYDRLLGSQPIHASPAEHQAEASDSQVRSGNFSGWIQYRKTIPSECINIFTPGLYEQP